MAEWLDNQKQSISSIRQLLQERIENANPRRELTTEEAKRLNKLEAIADKLKRGENVQNRQLQIWLSEDEHAQLEAEWHEQLRGNFKAGEVDGLGDTYYENGQLRARGNYIAGELDGLRDITTRMVN